MKNVLVALLVCLTWTSNAKERVPGTKVSIDPPSAVRLGVGSPGDGGGLPKAPAEGNARCGRTGLDVV